MIRDASTASSLPLRGAGCLSDFISVPAEIELRQIELELVVVFVLFSRSA
jgi:hypothetical protein